MAKDPAVLFYTSDFIAGTITMTDEQRGKYILLLCLQHQKGFLTEKEMLKICNGSDEEIWSKFKENNGYFFNERMKTEADKRRKYTESRRNNRNKASNDSLYIYLIKNKNNGYIKIGSSVNPERRIIELQNKTEDVLEIIATTELTSQTTESDLHKKYQEKNVHNEWFQLTDDDVDNIIRGHDMNIHMS